MDKEFIKEIITTSGIDDRESQVIVHAGSDMYSFFKQKKDGSETKAFETFKKFHGDKHSVIIGVTYVVNGKYKNIMSFEPVDPNDIKDITLPFTDDHMIKSNNNKDASIIRQVALKCASMHIGSNGTTEDVLAEAVVFENWLNHKPLETKDESGEYQF